MRLRRLVGLALLVVIVGCRTQQQPNVPSHQETQPSSPAAAMPQPVASQRSLPAIELPGYPKLGSPATTLPEILGDHPEQVEYHGFYQLHIYASRSGDWKVTVQTQDQKVTQVEVSGPGPIPWTYAGLRLGSTLDEVKSSMGGRPEEEPPTREDTQEYFWHVGSYVVAFVMDVQTQQVSGIALRGPIS